MPPETTELRRRKDDRWHIGKTVDLGHLVTTTALVIAGLWFFATMNTRIAVLEDRRDTDRELIQEMRDDIRQIKDMLTDLRLKGAAR